jgi:hypothetical protein
MKQSMRGPWLAMLVVLGTTLSVAGCQDGYPIAVTRCDRWCDVVEKHCESYQPAACVLGCEQKGWGHAPGLGSRAACEPAFDALLTCLEAHRSEVTCYQLSEPVPACIDAQTALVACATEQAPHVPNGTE